MPIGIYTRIIGVNCGLPTQGFQKGNQARGGKIPSEETKKKMSERKIGNTNGFQKEHKNECRTKESYRKVGISMLGKKHSEETKRKNREWQIAHPNKKFKNTGIEVKMQDELKKRGIKFETHKPILKKFNVDIFVEPNIVIECDGDYWHNLSVKKEKDRVKDIELRENGYEVVRFWEHEINHSVEKCVDTIKV